MDGWMEWMEGGMDVVLVIESSEVRLRDLLVDLANGMNWLDDSIANKSKRVFDFRFPNSPQY